MGRKPKAGPFQTQTRPSRSRLIIPKTVSQSPQRMNSTQQRRVHQQLQQQRRQQHMLQLQRQQNARLQQQYYDQQLQHMEQTATTSSLSSSSFATAPSTFAQPDRTPRIPCLVCDRTFSQRKYLNFHLRWECGRQLVCPKCQQPFNSKSYLNLHVKKCNGVGHNATAFL